MQLLRFNPVISLTSRLLSVAALLATFTLTGGLAGCGGGSSSSAVPESSSIVQLNFGDAPADQVLAFTMRVSSMELTRANGAGVAALNREMTMEMTRLMATYQPVAIISAPQGSYTGAKVTISAVSLTALDPATGKMIQQSINGPFTATASFATPVNLDSTPHLFNFDFDLQHSLSVDGTGKYAFSPQVHAAAAAQGKGGSNDPASGGAFLITGTVTSVSDNLVMVDAPQAAQSFSFTTNGNTKFGGNMHGKQSMQTGMGVQVRAAMQGDGSLQVNGMHSRMNAGGMMGGGIITEVTGSPATELTVVMQNGAGASVNTSYLSQPLTVTLTSETGYEIDDDRIDLSGLGLETDFDASHIYAGQSVLPVSESTGMTVSGTSGTAGTMTASYVRLEEQGFRGTTDIDIVPANSTHFTLTLPADCAFTGLTGASTITVYQLATTNVHENTTITAGSTLRVHGLLFKNGTDWILVASTISAS